MLCAANNFFRKLHIYKRFFEVMNEFFLHNNCHFNLTVQLTWKITWSRPRQEKLELILSFFLISAHLNHIRTVAGINHVGIGASYDGINA